MLPTFHGLIARVDRMPTGKMALPAAVCSMSLSASIPLPATWPDAHVCVHIPNTEAHTRWKLNMTDPGSATLLPVLVMAAFTSLAVRLTLSVRQSMTKPVPPGLQGARREVEVDLDVYFKYINS